MIQPHETNQQQTKKYYNHQPLCLGKQPQTTTGSEQDPTMYEFCLEQDILGQTAHDNYSRNLYRFQGFVWEGEFHPGSKEAIFSATS